MPRSSLRHATAIATAASIAAYGGSLLQQILYGRTLGVGPDTDALAAALAWAIATSGLVGTVATSVIVPRYLGMLPTSGLAAREVFRTGAGLALGAGLLAAAVNLLAAGPLSRLLLVGASDATQAQLAGLLRVTAPLHLVWVVVWLGIGLANARERYALAGLSPLFATAPVVVALLSITRIHVEEVAAAYLVGAAMQALLLIAILGRRSADLIPVLSFDAIRPMARSLALISGAFLMFNAAGLALRIVASHGPEGDVAITDYALRLIGVIEQLLLTGALAVLLTRWSQQGLEDRHSALPTLTISVGVVVVAVTATAVVAPDVIALLFASTRFDVGSVDRTAAFLRWAAPGIAAHMILMVALRAILATRRWIDVLAIAIVTVAATIASLLPVHAALGLPGVAVGYSIGWLAGAAATIGVLFRGAAGIRAVAREAVAALAVVAPAGAASGILLGFLPAVPLLRIVAAGALFAVVATPLAAWLDLAVLRATRAAIHQWSNA